MTIYLFFNIIIMGLMTVLLCYEIIYEHKKENNPIEIKEEPKEVDIERVHLLLENNNPIEKINQILDNIIDNYIKLYQVQNPSLDGSYQYIKPDEVNNIILPYVYFMTMKSMTPEVISLLSLVYVFKSFDLDNFLKTHSATNFMPSSDDTNTLEWVVFTRVNLAVINFVNNINK